MKYFQMLCLLVLLQACKQPLIKDDKNKLFLLFYEDTIGNFYGTIPSSFDTMYSWLNKSDCGCCDKKTYRLQPKKYRIVKESGFFGGACIDSGLYMTIEHSPYSSCERGEDKSQYIIDVYKYRILDENKKINPKAVFDSSQVIHNLRHYVFIYDDSLYSTTSNELFYFNKYETILFYKDRRINITIASNVITKDSLTKLGHAILNTIEIK